MQTIDTLRADTRCRLQGLGGQGGFRRRLLEMGFVPGTELRVVRRVEVGGLIELELRGCRVTLRNSEAREIFVEAC